MIRLDWLPGPREHYTSTCFVLAAIEHDALLHIISSKAIIRVIPGPALEKLQIYSQQCTKISKLGGLGQP